MTSRTAMRFVFPVLPVVVAVILVWSAAMPAPAQNAPAQSGNAQAGEAYFKQMCADCHGDDAAGDGPEHTQFIPHPANLTLVRDTPSMFASIVRYGVPGTAMPPHPNIPEANMRDVYAWIQTLPMDTTNQWARPWHAEQESIAPDTGPALYVTMCRRCHGDNATGDGPWAQNDNHIWPKPANFRARNSDLGRVYYIITNGRNGTMMPPMEPTIPARARLALAEYVHSLYSATTTAAIPHGTIERYTNPFTVSDQTAISTGKDKYDLYCAYCHNASGKGTFLAPRLIDRSWYFGGGTDNAVFAVVANGVPGELMPPHHAFDAQMRWAIITYLRHHGGLPEPITQMPVTDGR